MKRDLDALSEQQFDILVIGGGVYGSCIARDAALRGLSVALIEKSDFCSGTSHNSLKIIHSGIRYLQHFDFRRVRESISERRIWLTIAPHLVRPLRFVIPTQGYLTRGPLALQIAIVLHRLLGLDWNRGVPHGSRIPLGRVVGKAGLQKEIPGLPTKGLSGAASWHDGHAVEADRLVLECLQSAAAKGAAIANYVSAESLLCTSGRVDGVVAMDHATGRQLDIRARITVNAAGPWIQKILQRSLGDKVGSAVPPLAKNMNIVTRQLMPQYGVGIPSKRPSDATMGSESRLFFITPWKGVSVIGTTHFPYEGDPDDFSVSEADVQDFIDEVNCSYPPAKLTADCVFYVYSGLTPAEPGEGKGEVERSRHAEIVDHASQHDIEGLLSVVGVKYTTSRLVAERVTSLVQNKLGMPIDTHLARTELLPGAIGRVSGSRKTQHSGDDISDLLDRYGCNPPVDAVAGNFESVFAACVRHSVDHEMALSLDDFLLRRNDLAARGLLTKPLIRRSADAMRERLNWSNDETDRQQKRILAALRYLSDDQAVSQRAV